MDQFDTAPFDEDSFGHASLVSMVLVWSRAISIKRLDVWHKIMWFELDFSNYSSMTVWEHVS